MSMSMLKADNNQFHAGDDTHFDLLWVEGMQPVVVELLDMQQEQEAEVRKDKRQPEPEEEVRKDKRQPEEVVHKDKPEEEVHKDKHQPVDTMEDADAAVHQVQE